MKHVFDTDEIAHLWMHQTQSDARNGQGNFYFNGATIYSYGSHFPIARHVVNASGQKAILFTTRGYSSTTSQHIGTVRAAIHGNDVPVLRVADPALAPNRTMESFGESILAAEKMCFGPSGKFRPKMWSGLSTEIERANAFAEFFGFKQRWTLPENSDAVKAAIEAEKARQAKIAKANERKRLKAEKQEAAIQADLLARWKQGESIDTYRFRYDTPVALRVVGDTVETSKGVSVPVSHAIRGIAFVRSVVASGVEYRRNGHTFHLGEFAIDRIETNGNLKAGCHYIEYAEIERIAAILEASRG